LLHSPTTVFLAEKGEGQYRLLPHSYLHIDEQVKVFDLHLCYVRPNDLIDKPLLLHIKTKNSLAEAQYNLGNTMITFHAKKYVLVEHEQPVSSKLKDGSYYDPGTKRLVLEIDYQELPQGNDA
jgi:hypothetical protein